MKILLAHRRFPGPFRLLVRQLLADDSYQLALASEADGFAPAERVRYPGLNYVVYNGAKVDAEKAGEVRHALDTEIAHGNGIAAAATKLRDDGFLPDLVLAAAEGGAALFLRQVLPAACHLHYVTAPRSVPDGARAAAEPRKAGLFGHLAFVTPLAGLQHADHLALPSAHDLAQFPPSVAAMATVLPETIDVEEIGRVRPRSLRLPNGTVVEPDGELITVSAAPPSQATRTGLARALLKVLAVRPAAQILLLRSDQASQALLQVLRGTPQAERLQAAAGLERETLLSVLKTAAVHLQLDPDGPAPSLLEALAAGCPLVAAKVGVAGEIVVDGTTGRLIATDDAAALADALLGLLADREAARRLGAAAAADARRRYDFATVAWPAWQALFARLVAEHAASRGAAA